MVTYELQVMKGGRWVATGMYQDRESALNDAQGSVRERYLGIRVIEDVYDPVTERYTEHTIYRDSAMRTKIGMAQPEGLVLADAPPRVRAPMHAADPFRRMALTTMAVATGLLGVIGGLLWFHLV